MNLWSADEESAVFNLDRILPKTIIFGFRIKITLRPKLIAFMPRAISDFFLVSRRNASPSKATESASAPARPLYSIADISQLS